MSRLLYPLFGLAVLGVYALTALTGTDLYTSVPTITNRVPAGYTGDYRAAPMVWHTAFHGPTAYRRSESYGGGSSYYGGGSSYHSGGGGFFGGYSGGK